jgi:putative cell wall-binding protein
MAVAATAVSAVAAVAAPSLASASVGQAAGTSQGAKAVSFQAAPAVLGAPAVTVPASATVGTSVPISVSGGTVPSGVVTAYDVDFGEPGQPVQQFAAVGNAASFTFSYTTLGVHTITVTARDATGSSPAGQGSIQINAFATTTAALSVSATSGSVTATQPFTVTLDATKSIVGTGATTLGYTFSCGAGGPTAVSTVAGKATCTFTAIGTCVVTVTVTDNIGSPATTASQTITVGVPQAPNLGAFTVAQSPTTPLTAVADFSKVTLDKNAKTPTFTVAWGDGQQNVYQQKKPSPVPTHTYAAAGNYSVQLTVNDGLGLATSVQQTTVVLPIVAAPRVGPTPVWRISGSDRFDTGVKVSEYRWAATTDTAAAANKHPGAVVLATGLSFPDALAGVPFAAKQNASLLLTDGSALNSSVEAEIKRILPADGSRTVYILGGYNAVSKAIESHVTGLGYKVVRYGGNDRYGTALQIAHAMGDPAHVVVARGDDFADALSAGPLAADIFGTGTGPTYVPAAIVLVDKATGFDPATKAYVQGKLGTNGLSVIAVGGAAAGAVAPLPGVVATGVTPNAAQIAGRDRYDTSHIAANVFAQSNPNAPVGVATGTAFADALTGGAYMASVSGPLLLTDPNVEQAPTTQAVQQVAATTAEVDVFGGVKAVSAGIYNNLVAAVHGVAKQF